MSEVVNGVEVIDGAELMERDIPHPAEDIVIMNGDGYITIKAQPNYDYNIELSRIDNEKKLVSWIHHLNRKPWMTSDIMDLFIEMVCKHHGMNYHLAC